MVNSMSGHRVAPGKLRFYSATKFAVTGLLEGWRQEVRVCKGNVQVYSFIVRINLIHDAQLAISQSTLFLLSAESYGSTK